MSKRDSYGLSTPPKAFKKDAASAGFTLVELMVALAVGALAITSVYTLGAASSRQFGEQRRISNVQTSLRAAMNQIKQDIARAGYLGSPNAAATGETCMTTRVPVAIDFLNNPPADFALVDPNNQHGGLQADRLVLTGAYETRTDYLITQLDDTGTTAGFQSIWHSFRRDFSNWWATPPAPGQVNVNDFTSAFQPNRWMRLQNQQGFKFFVAITASGLDANGMAQVTFANDPLPIGSPCVGAHMAEARAAPLSMIRYRLVPLTQPNVDDIAIKGSSAQLVREEIVPVAGAAALDPTQSALFPNTIARTLLDYVVNFDVDFVVDTRSRAGTGTLPCLVLFDDGVATSAPACASTGWLPEGVRSVVITLSVRTPEQDPRFAWLARVAGQPVTRYQFNPGRPGAARVRTMRAEILVSNLAQAGL
jgi:prepilin-type N-terminal cleavage/methylation domain-containing protein